MGNPRRDRPPPAHPGSSTTSADVRSFRPQGLTGEKQNPFPTEPAWRGPSRPTSLTFEPFVAHPFCWQGPAPVRLPGRKHWPSCH